MMQTSCLDVVRNPAAERALSICTSLKRWQIYDEETSLTFFYSDIEKCWLVRVNSGCCEMDGRAVHSVSDNTVVVERSVDIVLNGNFFTFNNHSYADGISKTLAHTLLRRKEPRLETEQALRIIQDNCQYYRDTYFVWDAVRRNRMFKYRCGEISLDTELLYADLAKGLPPAIESMKYEMNNAASGTKPRAFSVSEVLSAPEFSRGGPLGACVGWPPLRADVPCSGRPAPGLQAPCRYVNSYQVRQSQDVCGRTCKPSRESRHGSGSGEGLSCSSETLKDDDSSTSFETSGEDWLPVGEKRKLANDSGKRHKYQFSFRLEPAVEAVNMHSDSEQSTVTHISDLTVATMYPCIKTKRGCASSAEDGFSCECVPQTSYPAVENRKGHKKSSMSRYNRLRMSEEQM